MIPKIRLNSPVVQNFFASVTVALGPGIYGAITILGAGGGQPSAAKMANIANSVLYAVYFVIGLMSGSIVTTIGPRWTIAIGTFGYPLYVGSLWYYSLTGALWFPIFGGAILGLCAALLWTGCGYIAFSYPEEKHKGSFISMQSGLLSVGGTISSFLAFGLNYNATVAQVPTAVYLVFICLMASSLLVALFLIVPSSTVRRSDGTALAEYPSSGFWTELKAQAELFKDWRLLALFIPMVASEVAVIVFSTLNALYFNLRTRSLNSVMFTFMQAVGALAMSYLLDHKMFGSRRTRGLISATAVGIFIIAGWIGITVWLYVHPFDPLNPPAYDWTSGGVFGGFFCLNLMFGINMCVYQVVVQWIVASFTNDPRRLARFAGMTKGCVAAGLAVSFGTEAGGLSQLNVVAFNFTLQTVGIMLILGVSWKCIQPTNYLREQTVIPPTYVAKQLGADQTVKVEMPAAVEQKPGSA